MRVHKSVSTGWTRTVCGRRFENQAKDGVRVVFDTWKSVTCKSCLKHFKARK